MTKIDFESKMAQKAGDSMSQTTLSVRLNNRNESILADARKKYPEVPRNTIINDLLTAGAESVQLS